MNETAGLEVSILVVDSLYGLSFIENMDTLHSIYFMSLCRKGGICSNSTFSGWATVLNRSNDSTDKIVIFPNKWINTPQKVDIPFDYTISF
jgi:hypothetical protein